MRAFLAALATGLPFGLLLGALFGPLRLAGVDYSAWYRNPAELSEGNDRTWIGLAKGTLLNTARLLVAAAFLSWVAVGICHGVRRGIPDALLSQVAAGAGRAGEFVIGLALGAAIVQGLLEALWHFGLRVDPRDTRTIRLSRPPSAAVPLIRHPAGSDMRRLIVCCDGTWNSPAMARETNVVQLLRAIRPESSAPGSVSQIAYYHLGVGTGNAIDRLLGGGAGVGLSNSVKACYGFLVDNYREGDEILLFGFSRGAYVVRSVAGLVGLVGLLRRPDMHRFAEVWDYYTLLPGDRARYDLDQIAPSRSRAIDISCVGVWDTVGALGVPGTRWCANSYAFHETALGAHVQYAFQALAMDERRGNFQPAVWVKTNPNQHLEQVWFPGVHSNCGGGYLEHGLSDSTLLWMCSRLDHFDLLDLDIAVIEEANGRFHAELPARGQLQDSRSIGWKLIAGPVPRPIGITDPSERIHQTAFDRKDLAPAGDPYARAGRQTWLHTIPAAARQGIGGYERAHAFAGPGTGTMPEGRIPIYRPLCDRVLSWFVGEA